MHPYSPYLPFNAILILIHVKFSFRKIDTHLSNCAANPKYSIEITELLHINKLTRECCYADTVIIRPFNKIPSQLT